MTAPVLLSGSNTILTGGTVDYSDPGGVTNGMELYVIICDVTTSGTRTTIDAWDNDPTTLTFTECAPLYAPGTFPSIRGWKYQFVGGETFPLHFSNTDGGSAVYLAFIISGQRSSSSTIADTTPFGTNKAINTNPFVTRALTSTENDTLYVTVTTSDGSSSYSPPSTPTTTAWVNASGGGAGWVTLLARTVVTAGSSGTNSIPYAAADGGNTIAFMIRPAAAGGGQVNARNGVALSGVSAIDGITKSGISAVNGLTI